MNILITGSDGFIGNNLVGKLKSSENTVIGFGRGTKLMKMPNQPDKFVKGSILDYNLLREVIADEQIDEIYHLAAKAIVRTCANDPYSAFNVNVMGTANLLEAVRVSGPTVKSVTISTSDKAFGHSPPPYTETTPLNPKYTYETSKACQQILAQSYFFNQNVPTKIVACSNLYGPGDPNMTRIIPNTITRLAKGKPALLNEGVADFVREFVYVDDATDAFVTVSRKGSPGEVYCCGGTEHLKMGSLIEKICNMMGKNPKENIQIFKTPPQFKEIETQWIDSTKLRSLGWEPKYSLDKGLAKTIEWYKDLCKNEEKNCFTTA
ncbi:MAG: GDP-mannose 4,6-dehydratase [Candidatus Pacearchaeota archaeon]|jgi:CDP-glucose 4,6-dehydratase